MHHREAVDLVEGGVVRELPPRRGARRRYPHVGPQIEIESQTSTAVYHVIFSYKCAGNGVGTHALWMSGAQEWGVTKGFLC